MRKWVATSSAGIAKAKHLGVIEFKDRHGRWHDFMIFTTPFRILFGGMTNVGFLESGYLPRDNYLSLDENLQELLADLEVYYNDGKQYVSRIVTNARM